MNQKGENRMNLKASHLVFFVIFSLLISGCGAGQLFGPTTTPTATITKTATSTPTVTLTPTITLTPTVTLTPTPTQFGGGGGKIAFTSLGAGGTGLFIMNGDGTHVKQLTYNVFANDPSWSPDGKGIIFSLGSREIQNGFYIINADGSDLRFLSWNSNYDMYPNWSPDGSKILFSSCRNDSNPQGCSSDRNYEIYSINLDGSDLTRLTNDPARDTFPVWSPDGKRIAFVTDRNGASMIFIMNSDGSQVKLLTEIVDAWGPSWSPDGKK
jgi:Tol biopolymer transport system component